MSLTWKIVVVIVSSVVILCLGYWIYLRYQSIKGPQSTAIEAIHQDVVFFAQSNDIRASLYKLTTETDYWQELLNDSLVIHFQCQFEFLDSLISSNAEISEVFEFRKFTLSFNKNPNGYYNFIFLMELPRGDFSPSVEGFIKEVNGEQSIVINKYFEKAELITVNLTGPEELFYYSIYKGLFIGSFDESLVKNSINRLNSKNSLLSDEFFTRIHSTAGKNVEANIYIHLPNFSAWAGQHLSEKYLHFAEKLENFGFWSEIDLLVNSDDLLFNGYAITPDTMGFLLDPFRQTPQSIKAPEILPFDIAWMMHWGIDDFKKFILSSCGQSHIKELYERYKKEYDIVIESEFLSWIGNEVVLAALPQQSGNSSALVIVHSNDVVKAVLSLGSMESKVNRKTRIKPFVRMHHDYTIKRLGIPRLFNDFFGEPFPFMKHCYYVSLKDYIVFSGNVQDLVRVIDHFYNQKTLLDNVNYQAFSDNISDRSNIYVYCNLKNTDPVLNEVLRGIMGQKLLTGLKNFEGLALQFSYINRMFYTNMFLSYNPEYREIKITNWETELEANLVSRPYFVRNHRNGKLNIVVFDKGKNMYLIDHVGRIQWQLPLIEVPAGNIYMVDYYNNGKFQYFFNTRNYIYLIDLNGNYVGDYPVKLITRATNQMAVFDYDHDKDYRLILALGDNKIYNFDKHWSAVDGWEKIQASGAVEQEVQHLVKGNKDYFFVSDENGNVKITDRRGYDRIKPRAKIKKAKHAVFYINRTNNKGLFLTTNKDGKVIYVDEKGGLSRTTFSEFSPDHFFFYEDFDDDDHMDFLYIDQSRMVVYNRFKEIVAEQKFEEQITQPPVLFSWAGRFYMGIIFDGADEIRIYDYQGRRFQDQYILGNLPFVTGSLQNGHLNLITGKGSKVLNFQLN